MNKELKTVSEDYLKVKLVELEKNKVTVDNLIRTYLELSKKIEGAIEITNALVEDLNKVEEVKTDEVKTIKN